MVDKEKWEEWNAKKCPEKRTEIVHYDVVRRTRVNHREIRCEANEWGLSSWAWAIRVKFWLDGFGMLRVVSSALSLATNDTSLCQSYCFISENGHIKFARPAVHGTAVVAALFRSSVLRTQCSRDDARRKLNESGQIYRRDSFDAYISYWIGWRWLAFAMALFRHRHVISSRICNSNTGAGTRSLTRCV